MAKSSTAKSSVEQRVKAYEMYLSNVPNPEIAKRVGVSVVTIRDWIERGKWPERRDMLERELMKAGDHRYLEFANANRLPTAQRQLDAAREIELRILQRLRHKNEKTGKPAYLTARDMATLAKALKDASEVSGRAVGLYNQSSGMGSSNIGTLVFARVDACRIKKESVPTIDIIPDPF